MAVKLRLTRQGRHESPFYRIVAADSRYTRDGRFIEQIGYYDPKKGISSAVINEEAYQSKFEIDFTGENFYYKTENSFWGGSCTTNCDSPENTTKETTTYNFIEIVEHYDENIEISNVYVTYTNGNSEYIKVSDMVRWTHVNGGSYYNPVYIGTTNRTTGNWWNKETDDIMNDTYIIDTVAITYDRTGYGRYTVYFKYDASTKTFTPYDEIKIS